MPVKQPLRRQWLIIVLGRVHDHLDNTVDVAVRPRQAADVDSEPACDRGAHLVSIEILPLDLARFENILG